MPLKSVSLTTLLGIESDPAISPDGTRLAYAWMNPQTGLQNIYIKIIDDPSSDLQLTESNSRDSSPAWSPNGSRIAFMRHTVNNCWIYLISSIGGKAEKFVSCSDNGYADLSWAPDGRWLAFNDKTENGNFGIVLVDTETGAKKYLTQPSSTYWGDYDPCFSPDGSRIAFARAFSEGMQDLFVIDIKNGKELRLTSERKNIFGLTWSKGKRQILFSSNRYGTYDLWAVSLLNQNIHPVYRDNSHIINPDIHENNRIIYESRSYDMNIWNYTFSNGMGKTKTSSPFINSTSWELYPSISPDDRKLAFITNRSGGYELWAGNADGTEVGQLTNFDGPFVSNPDWSPDNTQIVFDARPDGHADIYRIHTSGGKPIPVVTSPANDLVPRWSRDGNWIYFASDRTGRWQVWKTLIDGSQIDQVTGNGGFAARESINGDRLYFTKRNKFGIWSKSGKGEESIVVENLDPGDWGNWHNTEQGIYFINRLVTGNPIISLKKFSADDLITILETDQTIPTHDASFTINSRGNRILLGKQERRESNLMSIQFPSNKVQ